MGVCKKCGAVLTDKWQKVYCSRTCSNRDHYYVPKRATCKNGHEYTDGTVTVSSRGYRKCVVCQTRSNERRNLFRRTERPRQVREAQWKRLYGVTPIEVARMYEKAGSKCEICHVPERDGETLCIDHCHKTGAVRGLLCDKCNNAIGRFDDNPSVVYSALAYLMGRAY